MKRLHELAAAFAERFSEIGAETELLKSQVFVMQVESPAELWDVVTQTIPDFLMSNQVRLIVVDSVGGLYRVPDDGDATGHARRAGAQAERAQHAMRLAAKLKQVCVRASTSAQPDAVPRRGC